MSHYMTRFFLRAFVSYGFHVWANSGLSTTSEREDAVFWDSVFSHNHVLAIPRRKDGQTGEIGPKVDFGTSLTASKPMLSSITNCLRGPACASRAIRLTVSLPTV